MQTSTSAAENSTIIYPAFSETYPDKESSNDLAQVGIDLSTGTISSNTVPIVWKDTGTVLVNIENVPTDKNTLDIEIESVPAAANFELICLSNDTEISRTKSLRKAQKFSPMKTGSPRPQ